MYEKLFMVDTVRGIIELERFVANNIGNNERGIGTEAFIPNLIWSDGKYLP